MARLNERLQRKTPAEPCTGCGIRLHDPAVGDLVPVWYRREAAGPLCITCWANGGHPPETDRRPAVPEDFMAEAAMADYGDEYDD